MRWPRRSTRRAARPSLCPKGRTSSCATVFWSVCGFGGTTRRSPFSTRSSLTPHTRHLTKLGISNNIDDDGERALAASQALGHLTELYLADNDIGDEGRDVLAALESQGDCRVSLW
jgi:hypothetical protein